MAKYIVKWIRNTESNHVSTTIEMSYDEAKSLYNEEVNNYTKDSKFQPYKQISLCKVEYTALETVNLK